MVTTAQIYDEEFEHVVGVEGKYSNDPNDNGGETMYGITIAVARANGYTGPMRDMPLSVAKSIYKKQYWDLMHLDEIAPISRQVAHEMFDTGVNMGTGKAAMFLQRSLSALNRRGRDYPDLTVDGQIGPMSISALKTFLNARGRFTESESVLVELLNSQQGARYLDITEGRPQNEDFIYGWTLQRVVKRG